MNSHNRPNDALVRNGKDYARIATAIEYLEEHFLDQPDLETVAGVAGLSPYHFQRLFRRWCGVSPKRFVQYLTLDYAKARLREAHSVLDTALDAGLSGPGRLHDLFVSGEAMTPGEYKDGGEGTDILFGVHPSPFGPCFVGQTARGICALGFADGAPEDVLDDFRARWPRAHFRADADETAGTVASIFGEGDDLPPLPLHVWGTNFQLKVWEALLRIPSGHVVSYSDVATAIGKPSASRAVGSAVAANPISFLIPCHRVIRRSGRFNNYYWGPARKRVMLAWEAAQREPEPEAPRLAANG